jgi:cell division protein FtsI/penicillin-binding protein 2
MAKRKSKKSREYINKIFVLQFIIYLIVAAITFRLFYLQIVRYDYYQQVAAKAHFGYTELPARRGEIFIKDYASGEDVRVATNITLDTLFADPTIIENKKLVADKITPLIYNPAEARELDNQRIETERKRAMTQEELDNIKTLSDEELYTQYYDNLLESISQEIRPQILLTDELPEEVLEEIMNLGLSGIESKDRNLYAYPPQIVNRDYAASSLSKYLDIDPGMLEQILQGKNRYLVLKKKISPEISTEIRKIKEEDKDGNFTGIGLQEEYYRFYPEKELAANVLGFVTPDGLGQYGIEGSFNAQLQGKKGVFKTSRDGSVYSRQITVGDSIIEPAVDGEDIVLTIDRSMQMTIEEILARGVKEYRADSGQAIVMDPKTGKIMAMAHYPSFNPNSFSEVLDTVEVNFTNQEIENLIPVEEEENAFWFYRNFAAHDRYKVLKEVLENGKTIYKHYKNWIGLAAYQNLAVSGAYEPGSVFKAITMASAIDDKDVTPSYAFNDPGVLKVDEYEITNVMSNCTGYITMTRVIEYSCNTGIGHVAQKMGRNLFYSYMKRFGFGTRTNIEFDNEHPGQIEHFNQWADSELVTHGFGQGFLATPIQMTAAYGAMANDGILMQPYIIEKIIQNDGKIVETAPKSVQTVISKETSDTITAMLVSAVESGVASNAQISTHYIAAKTGTSQTYRYGKPLEGAGTTLASIAGYGPINDPKFVLYVKLDRPRTSEYAGSTTANIFRDIAEYLYEYLGIPPDKG